MKRCIALLGALLLVSVCASAADAPATRADFAVALWEADGSLPSAAPEDLRDVEPDAPYAEAVGWCRERSLMLGTGGGQFEPERPITREEAAIALRRYCAHLGIDVFYPSGVAACNDYEDISPWADDSLYWACGEGWMEWSEEGRLDPYGTLSQTQLEQMLARVLPK